jgi:hypothetical protein
LATTCATNAPASAATCAACWAIEERSAGRASLRSCASRRVSPASSCSAAALPSAAPFANPSSKARWRALSSFCSNSARARQRLPAGRLLLLRQGFGRRPGRIFPDRLRLGRREVEVALELEGLEHG